MKRQLKMRGTKIDATGYVINRDAKIPEWVKCYVCGKGPTAVDWLKPVSPDPKCRKLIHLSHIPDHPQLSLEAGYIARNA